MTWYHVVVCLWIVFQQTFQQQTQTLTKEQVGKTTNGVQLTQLDTYSVFENANGGWDFGIGENDDNWGLWILTKAASGWGFNDSFPSSFSVQLSGQTETSNTNFILAIGDGNDAKSIVIDIALNGQSTNQIAPGCDNIINPTQLLNPYGDVYYTLAEDPSISSLSRKCRPAYVDAQNTCPYDTFGSGQSITWPIKFTLNNYPSEGWSSITFEANGYNAISCGFGEAFATNVGLNVYMTGLLGDEFIISQMDLTYDILPPTTASPTTSTPTMGTTNQPSKTPSINPTTSPSQNPSVFPTTTEPSSQPSMFPSSQPSISPTINPSTNPSMSPTTTQPSVNPSINPTLSPSQNPSMNPTSATPTSMPSQMPTINPSLSPTINPSSTPSLSPSTMPSISPSNNPTSNPTTRAPLPPGATYTPTNHPTTSTPTTSIPTSSMPTSSMPTSSMPTTSMPTTSYPTTFQPTLDSPSPSLTESMFPTTLPPSTSAPTTSSTNPNAIISTQSTPQDVTDIFESSDTPTSSPTPEEESALEQVHKSTMSLILVIVVSVGTTIVIMLCLFTCCAIICKQKSKDKKAKLPSLHGTQHSNSSYFTQTAPSRINTHITGPTITELEDQEAEQLPPMPIDTPIRQGMKAMIRMMNPPQSHHNHGQIAYIPQVNHSGQFSETELHNMQYSGSMGMMPEMPEPSPNPISDAPSLPPSTQIQASTRNLNNSNMNLRSKPPNIMTIRSHSISGSSGGDPIDMDGGDIVTEVTVPVEGDRTIPERDVIDRLYGGTSPVSQTDIESLYDGKQSNVFGDTNINMRNPPQVKVTISMVDEDEVEIVDGALMEEDEDDEEDSTTESSSFTAHAKDAMYEEPEPESIDDSNFDAKSRITKGSADFLFDVNGNGKLHGKTRSHVTVKTTLSISEMVLSTGRDKTHGSTITMDSNDKNLYEENESKEEYYDGKKYTQSIDDIDHDDNVKNGDSDDYDVLTPRLNEKINYQIPKPQSKQHWM